MTVPVACACGAHYNLKDQYAGRLLECPACGTVLRAPEKELPSLFGRDIFQLREKHLAIDTKYYVRDEDGKPLLYVERPAEFGNRLFSAFLILSVSMMLFYLVRPSDPRPIIFAAFVFAYFVGPRRHIYFYTDDRKQHVLFTITQNRIVQFPVTSYTLYDDTGQVLARYRKSRLTDFWRKRWLVADADGQLLLTATEDSIVLSLLRRLTGLIVDIAFFRTNFVFYAADGERVVGEFNRKLTLFDRYTLDLSEDAERTIDRRIALGLGVLLDTGEGR